MQVRPLLLASFIAAGAPLASAQQVQPLPPAPQAAKPPKPAVVKPKPAVKKPVPTAAAPAAVKARLLEKIGDWSVFIHEDASGRVCFAAAAPTDMQPKTATANRTPVVFYITTWQKDGVRNEVSVKLGYSMKANSSAAVTAGGQHFALPGSDDKAYAKDTGDERKLLAAMSAGGQMAVKATSAKGTATTDQYSLDGASAAVQKLQEVCP
jgi:Invasion associated locus B (IalB) protein